MASKRTKFTVIAALLCSVIALAIVLFYWDGIHAAMDAAKLLPQPERFTELYFINGAKLPKTTASGQAISFSFAINNLQGSTTTYPYEIYFEDSSGGRTNFFSSYVVLPADASTTIPVKHTFLGPDAGRVVVNLINLNQSIDFLVNQSNP